MQILRSQFFTFQVRDKSRVRVSQLLRSEVEVESYTEVACVSATADSLVPVETSDLEILSSLSGEAWEEALRASARLGVDRSRLEKLVEKGLLLSDSGEPRLAGLREREMLLRRGGWAPESATYHTTNREEMSSHALRSRHLPETTEGRMEAIRRFIQRQGPPPPAFFESPSLESIEMPSGYREGELWRTLLERSTSRTFDVSRKIPLETVSTLLAYSFGCHGVSRLAEGYELLRKTSPSGGGLHPIEAFPVALAVDGLTQGLYHYDCRRHSLASLQEHGSFDDLRQRIDKLCLNQPWTTQASLLVFLVARFDRSFWKYRGSGRSYAVVLLDAGHLSQTFYLAAGALGLGVFFTAAADVAAIDEMLGLTGTNLGTIGVLGCGFQAEQDDFRLEPEPLT